MLVKKKKGRRREVEGMECSSRILSSAGDPRLITLLLLLSAVIVLLLF